MGDGMTPRGRGVRALAASVAVASLAACNFAPPYTKPTLPTPPPTAYKEMGPWTPAVPADDAPRNQWWLVYSDKTLNDLETKLLASNPDLAAACAAAHSCLASQNLHGAGGKEEACGASGGKESSSVDTREAARGGEESPSAEESRSTGAAASAPRASINWPAFSV